MAAKQWYYREADGAESGPFSGVELRRLIQQGQVRRETYGEDFAESAERSGLSYEALLERILALGLAWRPGAA